MVYRFKHWRRAVPAGKTPGELIQEYWLQVQTDAEATKAVLPFLKTFQNETDFASLTDGRGQEIWRRGQRI